MIYHCHPLSFRCHEVGSTTFTPCLDSKVKCPCSFKFLRLVVYLPLWKIWVCQLGWWHSQYMEIQKTCSKPPISKVPGCSFVPFRHIVDEFLQARRLRPATRWSDAIGTFLRGETAIFQHGSHLNTLQEGHLLIWLVVLTCFNHLEKWWSSSMGRIIHSYYGKS